MNEEDNNTNEPNPIPMLIFLAIVIIIAWYLPKSTGACTFSYSELS